MYSHLPTCWLARSPPFSVLAYKAELKILFSSSFSFYLTSFTLKQWNLQLARSSCIYVPPSQEASNFSHFKRGREIYNISLLVHASRRVCVCTWVAVKLEGTWLLCWRLDPCLFLLFSLPTWFGLRDDGFLASSLFNQLNSSSSHTGIKEGEVSLLMIAPT